MKAKYDDWSQGGKKSENQFAIWLKVSQSSVNSWISGSRGAPKTQDTIERIALRYPEIYKIIGVSDPLGALPPKKRERMRLALREIADNTVGEDDPNWDSKTKEILERYGFTVNE